MNSALQREARRREAWKDHPPEYRKIVEELVATGILEAHVPYVGEPTVELASLQGIVESRLRHSPNWTEAFNGWVDEKYKRDHGDSRQVQTLAQAVAAELAYEQAD